MAGGLPPPRLFCDICDIFDEHDTDDCPLQAASDSPPHSMHHGKRAPGGSDRPYCDNCEGTCIFTVHIILVVVLETMHVDILYIVNSTVSFYYGYSYNYYYRYMYVLYI